MILSSKNEVLKVLLYNHHTLTILKPLSVELLSFKPPPISIVMIDRLSNLELDLENCPTLTPTLDFVVLEIDNLTLNNSGVVATVHYLVTNLKELTMTVLHAVGKFLKLSAKCDDVGAVGVKGARSIGGLLLVRALEVKQVSGLNRRVLITLNTNYGCNLTNNLIKVTSVVVLYSNLTTNSNHSSKTSYPRESRAYACLIMNSFASPFVLK